jgi:hypothetical protein
VKQQGTASLAEQQITQFVEDDQSHVQQCLCDPPALPWCFSRSSRLTASSAQ